MECLSCAMAHGYNFQSSSENDSMEAANEPKVNNLLNYKAGDTQKREHLHGKRSKHKNSADEYSNKHKSTQLTNQNHTSTLNAQDTQGTGKAVKITQYYNINNKKTCLLCKIDTNLLVRGNVYQALGGASIK